uniref:Guanylate cyclase domain-containing protein n=1 Tax=Ditylum brightwellii TaxID=49249 RepID=A0A7S4R8L9_9STRA
MAQSPNATDGIRCRAIDATPRPQSASLLNNPEEYKIIDTDHLRQPEISLRIILPLLYLLRQKHGDAKVDRLIKSMGLDPAELNDTEAWVSIKFVCLLRDEIFKQLYGLSEPPSREDPLWQLWRQSGIVGFERALLGDILPVLRAFGSPGFLYSHISKEVRRANTVLKAEVISQAPGRVVLSMRPNDPETYEEGHEFCLNRVGVFEGVPLIWGFPKAHVEHVHCMHDPINPADHCEYIVYFKERPITQTLRACCAPLACTLLGYSAKNFLPLSSSLMSVQTLPFIGLIIGIGIEGWRAMFSIQKIYDADRKHMQNVIERADQRTMDLWRESHQLRCLALDNRNISAYIPQALLHRLRMSRQQAPTLGGSRREVTILFVDIRSYSTVSEHLDPEDTIRILNDCFAAWMADVQKYGGTVLEFLGDGMLAVFGAPNDQPNHASQAVRSVKSMVKSMDQLNESWDVAGSNKFWKCKGISKLGFRVGIHTGTVVAGNLGSNAQMKYAVVGDAVNVAARLEQLNKKLGTMIAVSGDTHMLLCDSLKSWLRPKGHHFVKGREQSVEIFTHGKSGESSHPPGAAAEKYPRHYRRLSLH